MSRQSSGVPIALLDRFFQYAEALGHPLHIAYLNLLRPPADAGAGFLDDLVRQLRTEARPAPPFNRQRQTRYGARWSEQATVDMDHHLVRLAVARPGTLQELMELVSELHAMPLDRSRPLWRVYVIEGLADGRFATYCKMHHALVDGVAGTRLHLRAMSADPAARLPSSWAGREPADADGPAAAAPHGLHRASGLAAGLAECLRALPVALAGAWNTRQERLGGRTDTVGGDQAPACRINRRIGDARRVAVGSLSRARIQALCERLQCSTNDVMLALCGAALRRYLSDRCDLPACSLVAMVPMSLRQDDSTEGNRVAPLLVSLGTDHDDPLQRLQHIRQATQRHAQRFRDWYLTEIYAYSLIQDAAGLFNLLLRPAHGRLAFNLVISKLSGPRTRMYWRGCRLEAMYPLSVLADGQALNISYATRDDTLDIGLLACPHTVPALPRLLDHLGAALADLEAGAGGAADAGAMPSRAGSRVYDLDRRRRAAARARRS